jgi:hypothetical protein
MAAFSATFPALAKSDVPVTRHFSLTGETNRHFLSHSENETLSFLQQEQGTFCDWLSLYQHHGQGCHGVSLSAVKRAVYRVTKPGSSSLL